MEYIHVLLFICANVVSCYHFYNPASHQILASTSFKNIPGGYKLLPPPRTYRRRARLTRGRINATCGDGDFTCDSPYDKSTTQQFECTTDRQCPSNYKCCPQKCFLHKICIQASSSIIDDDKNNCDKPRPGQCEKWPYNCRNRYAYASTYMFKCNRDAQCPRNFKCCQQTCFAHKICSRIVTNSKTPPSKIVKTTSRRTTTTTTTEAIPTTEEEEYEEETEAVEEDTIKDDYEEDIEVATEKEGDYNEVEGDESETTETVPERTGAEEEGEDTTTEKEGPTETEPETVEVDVSRQTTISTEVETVELQRSLNTTRKPIVLFKNTPKLTTPDSNAINPNYAEYYYHYDNTTGTDEDYEEDNEYDDDY